MDSGLLDLLTQCGDTKIVKDSKDYTHNTMYGPSKNWSILDEYQDIFWKKYCELALDFSKNLSLAEMPRKHMPLIIDFIFKFHPSDLEELEPYNDDFIISIVYCYQQIIAQTLKIDEQCSQLICCVLKAKTVVENNLIVARFRLQFPYCKTVAQIQNHLIRPLALQMLRTTNVFARLESQPQNEWEDIIDPLSAEKPVIMYGSSNNENTPKYVLEYIFPEVHKGDDLDSVNIMELNETFFPRAHEHVGNSTMKEQDMCDETGAINYEFWLPFFLSIYYRREITLPKVEIPKDNLSSSYKNLKSSYMDTDDTTETMTSIFLSMLSKERVMLDHFWLDIGKALYKAFNGEERGLEKWLQISQCRGEGAAIDCQNEYEGFTISNTSIRTLAYYAREDSVKEYEIWHQKWCFQSLQNALSATHNDVAEALYRVCWLEFACSSLGKSTFYQFRTGTWKLLDSGHSLKSYISGEFITTLEKFRIDVVTEIRDSTDKSVKESGEATVQKIGNLIKKLKNRSYKGNIYAECAEKFYIERFDDMLDSNPEIMGCLNCVLEVGDKSVVARQGKPEDYISITTGVLWRFDMHERHPIYIKLISYLTKVFPDRELLEYFGKLISASLKGKNADKIFPIHTGKGNNSKSMIKKLIEASFGSHSITIPTTFFTGMKTGGPQPEIARSKYAHIAFFQEPDAETPIKSGTIKELTGGDKFFARFLQSNGSEIAPMFTLHLMCNTIPIMTDSGDAMKNRVRVLPYLSTWTKNPPKDSDQQYRERMFLLDPGFEKQISEMAPAFLWWLVKIMYPKYKAHGIMEPRLVTEYTESYWSENDIYSQYILENVEKAFHETHNGDKIIDPTAYVSLNDLYTRFKDWFKNNYQLKVPDRSIFKNEMEGRVCKSLNRKYFGVRLKAPENHMQDF